MSGVGELMLVVMILRMGKKNVTCGASERRRPVLVAPHIFKDTFIFPLFFLSNTNTYSRRVLSSPFFNIAIMDSRCSEQLRGSPFTHIGQNTFEILRSLRDIHLSVCFTFASEPRALPLGKFFF